MLFTCFVLTFAVMINAINVSKRFVAKIGGTSIKSVCEQTSLVALRGANFIDN